MRTRDTAIFKEQVERVKQVIAGVPITLYNHLPKIVDAMLIPYERSTKQALLQHRRSGLLRKSIERKVTFYAHDIVAFGLVGPSLDVVGAYKGKKAWPAKYAHLLNYGTRPHLNRKEKTGEYEAVIVQRPGLKADGTPKYKAYFKNKMKYRYYGRLHPGAKPYPYRQIAELAAASQSIRAGEAALLKALKTALPPQSPPKKAA